MKIACPKCRQTVPPDQVNMGTDLAFCPGCTDGFRVSDTVDKDSVNPDILQNPPGGAWFEMEMGKVIVGATTRSPAAFFLVPFMCVWSGGSLGGIYGRQIMAGEFELGISLFGIPFVIGTVIFGALALMTLFGKVEVTIGPESTVFVGIGSMGWRRRFDWSAVRTIREDGTRTNYPGSHKTAIVMVGAQRLKFGSGLNQKRRYFVVNVLRYLMAENQ